MRRFDVKYIKEKKNFQFLIGNQAKLWKDKKDIVKNSRFTI